MDGLIEKLDGRSIRQINDEELRRLDEVVDWSKDSSFRTYAINSLLATMGMASANGDMDKIMDYAFNGAVLDKRTGNTGFTVSYGQDGRFRTVVSIMPVFDENAYTQDSPLIARSAGDNGEIEIDIGGRAKIPANVKKTPRWYMQGYKTSSGEVFGSELVQWENGVLMLSIPSYGRQVCAYLANKDNACKFCGLEQGKYKPLTPEILADIVKRQMEESGSTSMTMTGGNSLSQNRGFEKYIPFVELLRDKYGSSLPIELEASPPREQKYLDWLIRSNASFMGNVEVWDEDQRKSMIPAKARDNPRDEYMQTLGYLNEKGVDTYSVLIASLQTFDSLFKGTEELAKIGTTAVILPFKQTGGQLSEYRATGAADLMKATIGAANIMRNYGLFLDNKPKECCSGCGGCGADANLRDNLAMVNDPGFKAFEAKYGTNAMAGGD